MIIPGKEVWYGWNGGNEWLFRQINGIQGGDLYNALMIFLTRIGDYRNFPYYMGTFLVWALIEFVINKTHRKGGTSHRVIAWIAVFMVLIASYATDGLVVKTIKTQFAYPRPYIVLPANDVILLDQKNGDDDYHSFPSGHASFVTVMVVGLWPVLSINMCWFGMALIVGVCWSRIAVGMHFPADVLAGFFISLLLVLILRSIIYQLLNKCNIRC